MTDDIEELTRLVHDAPDLASRAGILDLDVSAVARASRRFLAITWSLGVAVIIAVAGIPTARFLAQVAGTPVAVRTTEWIVHLVFGAGVTFALLVVSGVILAVIKSRLPRLVPVSQTARFVIHDAFASVLVPCIAALSWIWFSEEPLFVFGTIAGATLVAMPRPRTFDFVGALAANRPRIGAAIARLQRADGVLTLVDGRSRWLTLQVVGNILAVPSSLLLILVSPWWVPAVMVIMFAMRTSTLMLEMRKNFRAAVFVQLGTGVVLAVLAGILVGGYFWPIVNWVAPAVPV